MGKPLSVFDKENDEVFNSMDVKEIIRVAANDPAYMIALVVCIIIVGIIIIGGML